MLFKPKRSYCYDDNADADADVDGNAVDEYNVHHIAYEYDFCNAVLCIFFFFFYF